jgi:hypothetical protein
MNGEVRYVHSDAVMGYYVLHLDLGERLVKCVNPDTPYLDSNPYGESLAESTAKEYAADNNLLYSGEGPSNSNHTIIGGEWDAHCKPDSAGPVAVRPPNFKIATRVGLYSICYDAEELEDEPGHFASRIRSSIQRRANVKEELIAAGIKHPSYDQIEAALAACDAVVKTVTEMIGTANLIQATISAVDMQNVVDVSMFFAIKRIAKKLK